MRFLNKYVTLLIGIRELNAYFRANPGDTLLDRVTVSDVAYTILLYESNCDVWKEEAEVLDKNPSGDRLETLKKAKRTKKLKYHVQKGARIPFGIDGWTAEGKDHYKNLVKELKGITASDTVYSFLQECWTQYVEEETGHVKKSREEVGNEFNERLMEEEVEEIDLPGDDGGERVRYGLTTHV